MKTAPRISIVLNLVLLGGLVFMWANQRRIGATSAPPTETKSEPLVQAVAGSLPPIMQQEEPKLFHWSQLESADYHTYVKNLRAIGCPEATLRAIVTADVHAVYRKQSRELAQKLADLNNSSWSVQFSSFNSQQAWKAELQKLPDEEAFTIADLLGLQPTPAREVAMDTTLPSQISSRRQNSQNAPVLVPLVMQNVDLSALNLTDQQIQVINDLRQSFTDEIGGPNQDPNDPAYLERWQKAQPEADDMLRGMLGITVWQNYQVAAQSP